MLTGLTAQAFLLILKKGTQVYVEGTPEVRTYQTNDGKSGASLSLRVQSVQLLGNKGEGVGAPAQGGYSNSNTNSYSNSNTYSNNNNGGDDINEAGDDLPF